jgi:UDP-3-O-[3-hydroxymyristoyl] glucosamine N-acyltransferase
MATVEMTLSELARQLGGRLEGDGTRIVRGVGTIESAGPEEVTFLANARYERHVESTRAAAVIVSLDYRGPGRNLIRCEDPYFAFRQAMVAFHGFRKPTFEGIAPSADIAPSATLGQGVRIGAFVTISADCRIGDGTVIYPGAFIGPNCRIGLDCTIYPNVTFYDGTILGERVTVHAGSSIGQDGFGYATHAGRHEKIPQAGWVELEDDVEIGACCAIDRATMGSTVIGAGTKFSNLVAIGHGTKMGKHCLMVAQSGIAGSVVVGNYCVFAGQSGVVGHIRIGDGVQVAAQSGVAGDVASGAQVGGSPAVPLAEARRAWMAFSRLPQLRTAVRKLTKELAALRKRLGLPDDSAPSDRREEGQ